MEVEQWLLAFVAHRAKRYKTPKRLIEEIDSAPPDPPPCPKGKIKIHVRRTGPSSNTQVNNQHIYSLRELKINIGNKFFN